MLVLKAQRADSTDVVDGEEIIHCIERARIDMFSRAPCFQASLGVVALDHSASPAVGFRIRYHRMKDRTVANAPMDRTSNWKA